MGGVGGGGGWKEKTTKGRQTVASVPSPLSLVSITTVSQQMVGRMGMKGGKKKGEKAPCCHSFRFSLPHSRPFLFRQVKKQSTFFAKLSNPQKSRNRKFQTPPKLKSFNQGPSLEIRSTTCCKICERLRRKSLL